MSCVRWASTTARTVWAVDAVLCVILSGEIFSDFDTDGPHLDFEEFVRLMKKVRLFCSAHRDRVFSDFPHRSNRPLGRS